MENVTALLLSNSAVENVTADTFMESQQVVNNPMVIFIEKSTNEVIKSFRIAADTMEKLTDMFKHKYFDTWDLPEEQYEVFADAYFIGVDPVEKKTERTAATGVHMNVYSI